MSGLSTANENEKDYFFESDLMGSVSQPAMQQYNKG